ncbi:MAG: hypothetical protein QGF49_06305, partial [Candidatus Marinimicrobia bacterium]|nr:hypothetical protein [Candidatus Neomarinimicrobiota bacterium]
MKIMSKIILTAFVFMGTIFPQSLEANYQLTSVLVEYHWVARAQESTEDFETGGYVLNGVWPSAATPAFAWGLKNFAVGDTAAYVRVPLTSQLGLDYFPYGPVALNCDFNDDGTFTINEGSTYPTTEMVDCVTSSTVPPVTESGTWTDGGFGTYTDDFRNKSSRGWGITYSGTFAWFNAPDLSDGTNGGGLYAVHSQYDGINWGRTDVKYNNDFTQIEGLKIHWTANDGVESNLGIVDPTDDYYSEEEEGMLNGIMGIGEAPSDNTTIPAIAALAATYGIVIHVPDNPVALGGTGQDIDGDGEVDGLLSANFGYLFDPVGGDGAPFSGDEPLQFTGYFFTAHFMNAVGIGQGTFEACGGAYVMGDDPTGNGGLGNGCLYECVIAGGSVEECAANCSFISLEECIDDAGIALLTSFGLDAPTAQAILATVYNDNLLPCIQGGGSPEDCVMNALVYAIGVAEYMTGGAWEFPDDSDHDVDLACLADGD